MSKIKKVIISFILFNFLISSSYAASVNDNKKRQETLYVTKALASSKHWSNSVNIKGGDKVAFDLHYLSDYGNTAENVKFFLENLDNKTFKKGHTENVWGKITSTSVNNKSGSVSVKFDENIKLNFYNVSWQKWPCQSVGCETKLPQSARNVINGAGLNIGSVSGDNNSHYAGNLIIEFKAQKVEIKEEKKDASVQTEKPTEISKTCAVLNGYLKLNDSKNEYIKFEYGTSSSDLNRIKNIGTKNSSTKYSSRICELKPDTKYYYRAITSSGKTGSIKSFRTDKEKNESKKEDKKHKDSTIRTKEATNVVQTCANLNSYLDLNDDNKEYVEFEYGTSKSNLGRIKKAGTFRENLTISERVCGLSPNTKYYFKARTNSDEGEILNFRTKPETKVVKPTSTKTSVITGGNYAGTYAADLYGSITGGDERVVCYFEYGTQPSNLTKTTSPKIKNVFSNRNCYHKVTGLIPNKKYYYRTIAVDDGIKYIGRIKSFATRQATIRPNKPTSNIVVKENVTITVEEVSSKNKKLQLNKWVSLNKDSSYGIETNAQVGQTVYYKVRVKNNTDDIIKNVTVTDHIPYELELSNQRSINDNTDKYLTWKIEEMKAGEVRNFITEMTVSNKATAGEVISSKAEIIKKGETKNTNTVDIYIKNSSSKQGANITASQSGFSVLKLFLWLGVLLLILIIGLLISRVLATRR